MTVDDPSAAWTAVSVEERAHFARFVYAAGAGAGVEGCWVWCGGIESDGGYGRYRPGPGGRVIAAHRWSYLAVHGPSAWPVVRHRCDVRVCVRPDHLIAGTQAANVADIQQRGAWPTSGDIAVWPALSYALRDAARAGDRSRIEELTGRPLQLELATGDPIVR